MSTVEKKQRYAGIKQEKNLCGPTCLQMVLFRKGVWVDQEALAARIGLRIDENDRDLYNFPLKAAPSDDLSCLGIKLTDHDIMANFWWEPINRKKKGHYALVSDYNQDTKELTLCDPSTEQKTFWKIHIDKLKEAMSKDWTGEERGFVVVKQRSD
jgi:hypothetical protein